MLFSTKYLFNFLKLLLFFFLSFSVTIFAKGYDLYTLVEQSDYYTINRMLRNNTLAVEITSVLLEKLKFSNFVESEEKLKTLIPLVTHLINLYPNVKDTRGNTLLMGIIAAIYADKNYTDYCYRYSGCNKYEDEYNQYKNLIAILLTQLLANPKLDINMKNQHGETVLLYATKYCNVELLKKLFTVPRINIYQQDVGGRMVLQIMVEQCSEDEYFKYENNNYNDFSYNYYFFSYYSPLIHAFLAHPIAAISKAPLDNTIMKTDLLLSKFLIMAYQFNSIDLANKILLHPIVDPNIQDQNGDTALMHAVISLSTQQPVRDSAMLASRLRARIRPVSEIDLRKLLGYPGLNINMQNKHGYTALLHAATHCNLPLLQLLLAQPGISTEQGAKHSGDLLSIVRNKCDNPATYINAILASPNLSYVQYFKGHTMLLHDYLLSWFFNLGK